jgi:hypothetical protein
VVCNSGKDGIGGRDRRFVLPAGAYQLANERNPCGPYIDNLAAVVLDALAETLLQPSGDMG